LQIFVEPNGGSVCTMCCLFCLDKTKLWYRDERQQKHMWFEVNTAVVDLKAYSKSSQAGMWKNTVHLHLLEVLQRVQYPVCVPLAGTNQCRVNNGNCQHLCLAVPGSVTCKCAHDHVALNATHCTLAKHCPTGSRLCLDGLLCRPSNKFCNGHVDCPDHSDENCEWSATTRVSR